MRVWYNGILQGIASAQMTVRFCLPAQKIILMFLIYKIKDIKQWTKDILG